MVDPQLIISGLVQRGVPESAAVGIAGNIAVESGFNPGINEAAPIVPGSRGGYGLIQWTGPRRRQFESYAGQNIDDLDTQLDFLVHELNTTERGARDAIYAAQDPIEAARLTSTKFLRPGIPHMDRRIQETRELMGGNMSPSNVIAQSTQQEAPPQGAPQNALMSPQQQQQQPELQIPDNRLDASQFMSRRRFTNALMPETF